VILHLLETGTSMIEMERPIGSTSLAASRASRCGTGRRGLVHAADSLLLSLEHVVCAALLGRKDDLLRVLRGRGLIVQLTFSVVWRAVEPVKVIAVEHLLG